MSLQKKIILKMGSIGLKPSPSLVACCCVAEEENRLGNGYG